MRDIFVFGSNTQGRHGKGAALEAKLHWGAIYGQSEGLQGNSYAIITKELRKWENKVTLKQIEAGVKKFLKFAKQHPEMTFKVTAIGCKNAGRTPKQIGPMFRKRSKNVTLPKEFVKYCRSLEDRFYRAWKKKFPDLPRPERQVEFCEGRKWPWDFAWVREKLAVEIQGGAMIGGRHGRGFWQAKDYEKHNVATKLGWRVLYFNTISMGAIDSGKVYDCVEFTAEVLCKSKEIEDGSSD